MIKLTTLMGNPFHYKRHPDGEIIVYTPDKEGNVQKVLSRFMCKILFEQIFKERQILTHFPYGV